MVSTIAISHFVAFQFRNYLLKSATGYDMVYKRFNNESDSLAI